MQEMLFLILCYYFCFNGIFCSTLWELRFKVVKCEMFFQLFIIAILFCIVCLYSIFIKDKSQITINYGITQYQQIRDNKQMVVIML